MPEESIGAYNIKIKQANKEEIILSFPGPCETSLESLFEHEYLNGAEFLKAFESKKQTLLDSVANYYAMGRKFEPEYEIQKNSLIIRINAASGTPTRGSFHLSDYEALTLMTLSMFVPNYRLIKSAIDLIDGPITINSEYAEKPDSNYFKRGEPALDEFTNMFKAGKTEREYIKIIFEITNVN